jgi:SAM-dependent methyltransferase
MNHEDHVDLLRAGILSRGGRWADLGSGRGAFTLALADLMGPSGEVYSVDRDRAALAEQERILKRRFPEIRVHYVVGDFTRPLPLPPLDGVVMANSLHFHARKRSVVESVRAMLKAGGRLILVEYNVDQGNAWVPYPLSYPAWERLAASCGFIDTHLIGTQPSSFLGSFYSAVSRSPSGGPGQ